MAVPEEELVAVARDTDLEAKHRMSVPENAPDDEEGVTTIALPSLAQSRCEMRPAWPVQTPTRDLRAWALNTSTRCPLAEASRSPCGE